MALLILILLYVFILYFDKKYYKTYFTPSIVLLTPFLIICILYDLNSERLGFYDLNYNILYVWVFGVFIFWITGLLTRLLALTSRKKCNSISSDKIDLVKKSYKLTNFVFLISLISLFYLRVAYNIYLNNGADDVDKYLSGGIQGHLLVIIKLFSILSFLSLFVKTNKINKLKNILIILVAISFSILYATKGGILILILSYFFVWLIFYKKKIKFFYFLIGPIIGFFIFYLTYSLSFGESAPLDFIWNHMITYYIGAIASLNSYLITNKPVGIEPELLFRNIINIINLFTNNSSEVKSTISNEWTNIGNNTVINVKTLFGTLYIYGGLKFSILATVIFSFVIHYFFNKKNQNVLFLILYTNQLAMLFFSWFDFYYNTLLYIESIVLILFLNFLINAKKTKL